MIPTPNAAALTRAASSLLICAALAACSSGSGSDSQVAAVAFEPLVPSEALTQPEYDAIVAAAAGAVDTPNLAIAIVDRVGNILRVWNRDPASLPGDEDNRLAVSVARTAAFLSHSQAPLPSRTGQFISTYHYPSTFAAADFDDPLSPFGGGPERATSGVTNTAQGPLWQIQNTNRGALWADPNDFNDPARTLPQLVGPDGLAPSPGLLPLPGGIPIYKCALAGACVGPCATPPAPPAGFDSLVTRRLVGAIGVYATVGGPGTDPLPEVSEFAAFVAAATVTDPTTSCSLADPGEISFFLFPDGSLPQAEGEVYLVGVLLPAIGQTTPPAGVAPGDPLDGANVDLPAVATDGLDGALDPAEDPSDGFDPDDYLIGPDGTADLLANEVDEIVRQTVIAARFTHAAIRLPASSPCVMTIAVTGPSGEILALFRMDDGTIFSVEIAITKARETYYFSHPDSLDADGPRAGLHPLDGIVPPGTAITARTLGFLTQPFFPPTIDGSPAGPLFELVTFNAAPANFDRMGHAPPGPNQSGLVLFPGSAPIYRDGDLVAAIGVSGDGVEQDDFVTDRGLRLAEEVLGVPLRPEMQVPPVQRCSEFSFDGVPLPYFKFPQNPGG